MEAKTIRSSSAGGPVTVQYGLIERTPLKVHVVTSQQSRQVDIEYQKKNYLFAYCSIKVQNAGRGQQSSTFYRGNNRLELELVEFIDMYDLS